MRLGLLVCSTLVFASLAEVDLAHVRDYQIGEEDPQRDVKWNRTSSPFTTPKTNPPHPAAARRKREDDDLEVEEETNPLPTRHAKHRRRRRCRNRATCSHVAESKHRQNDTWRFNERADSVENPSKLEEIEAYDEERAASEEFELEDASVPPWMNVGTNDEEATAVDFANAKRSSAIYPNTEEQASYHESLSTVLTKLFQSLRNSSVADSQEIFKEINFVDSTDEDPCQKWLNSRDKLEEAFRGTVASLPSCPCQYPSNIFYDDKLWDEAQRRHFRWRDVSGGSQRLDVYKPGAAYCVRSLLAQGSGSAAAQHCCYDRRRRLLTRGSGAGTPNFVSPEISPVLHERIDVLPWRLCKGDFSRYNGVRPPNNGNDCEANPDDEEYQRQIDDRKYY